MQNKHGAYEKKIKESEDYKDLSSTEKIEFDKNLKESLKNASKYQQKVNELLNQMAALEFELIEMTARGEDDSELKKKLFATIFDLENYGVVSKERLLENPGTCAQFSEETNTTAGLYAHTKTHLDTTITVSYP